MIELIYNFRIDRTQREEIIGRLKEEKMISQGWGGGEENLNLKDLDTEEFVQGCYEHYNLNSTRIPSNLTRIMDFKDSDILVIPHLPENGRVTFVIVDGDFDDCYDYKINDETHLNHCIKVKAVYGLEGNVSIYHEKLANWYGKLQYLRLPVLEIDKFKEGIMDVLSELKASPSAKLETSTLDEYLISRKNELIEKLREDVSKIDSSSSEISFERVCQKVLENNGYKVERTNLYDRDGGDVDLVCTKTETSPFDSGESKLFVQVKKHRGETDEQAVIQLSKMIKKYPEADGCVMTLAENFTEVAEREAHEKNITLLNGNKICELLIRSLPE